MPYRHFLATFALSAVVACSAPSLAFESDEALSDPAQETRARALMQRIRCLVCENDPSSPVARDIRILIRGLIKAGHNDETVLGAIGGLYSGFVLLSQRLAMPGPASAPAIQPDEMLRDPSQEERARISPQITMPAQ
jgi:cytochrome c-type biogenesis protein CcmH/NrfF